MAKTSTSSGDGTIILLGLAGLGAAFLYMLGGSSGCKDGDRKTVTCPDGSTLIQTCINGTYVPKCPTGTTGAEIVSFTIT